MITQATLFTDGGSRGNPGPSGIGFVLQAEYSYELVTLSEGGAFIGEATNNEAEYQALLWGLENARALEVRHLSIKTDSELLVKQIRGEYQVKSEGIKPLYDQVMRALVNFSYFDIEHVYRKDNSRADTLVNVAIDTEDSTGNYSVVWMGAEGSNGATCPNPSDSLYNIAKQYTTLPSNQTSSLAATDTSEHIYILSVKEHFDAAHALVGYPGEYRKLHGHTWDIEACISGSLLDGVGILYDCELLRRDLSAILSDYDHAYLNDVPPFDQINSTAENLARIIYERMTEKLPAYIKLEEISVWESPIAKLSYRRR